MNIVQLVNAWLIVMRNKVGSTSIIQLMNEKANCYLSFNFFLYQLERKAHAMPCMPKKCMVDDPFCSTPARSMRELTVTNSNKKCIIRCYKKTKYVRNSR